MTRIITTISFILTLSICQPLLGQGHVDSDSILHNIWWTTWKIDNDTTNILKLTSITNQKDSINYIAYYSKKGTICKIVRLTKLSFGTQMTSYYFADNKPIFISVEQNNYHLSGDKSHYSKTVHS